MTLPSSARPVLVTLANGVQGSATVRAALRHGFPVRALVRDPAKAESLRRLGAELFAGNLDDPASLRAACTGMVHLVLHLPTGEASAVRAQAKNAVEACRAAGVSSLVLRLASASRPQPCAEPSFTANHLAEELIRQSGLPFAVVRPTLYLDNLLKPSALQDIMEHGIFSPPILATQRIAWTSTDDCAEAALLLLRHGVDGRDHLIGGPASVTGEDFAGALSRGLGRTVRYEAQALPAFEAELEAAMPTEMARQVASKFRYFAAFPDEADAILARPFNAATNRIPGFQPSSIEDWARQRRAQFQPSSISASSSCP